MTWHQLQGKKANVLGSQFETRFQQSAELSNIVCTRMPDGCRQVGPKKLLRVRTPFDWILSLDGHTALIDTKTTAEDRFMFSKIDPHQVHVLHQHEFAGAIAGYVVEMREINRVVFLRATVLHQRIGTRGSFLAGDGIELGSSLSFNVRCIFPS